MHVRVCRTCGVEAEAAELCLFLFLLFFHATWFLEPPGYVACWLSPSFRGCLFSGVESARVFDSEGNAVAGSTPVFDVRLTHEGKRERERARLRERESERERERERGRHGRRGRRGREAGEGGEREASRHTDTDTHRHTQTHTDTHRHTHRHRHTYTHTHTHTQNHIHINKQTTQPPSSSSARFGTGAHRCRHLALQRNAGRCHQRPRLRPLPSGCFVQQQRRQWRGCAFGCCC